MANLEGNNIEQFVDKHILRFDIQLLFNLENNFELITVFSRRHRENRFLIIQIKSCKKYDRFPIPFNGEMKYYLC